MLRQSCSQLAGLLTGGRWNRLADFAAPLAIQRLSTTSPDTPPESLDSKTQIWVGNLPFKAHPRDIRQRFAAYGATRVFIMRDKETKYSRGMALIVVDADKCEQAIADNNGVDFQGRALRVAKSTVPVPVPKDRPAGAPAPSSTAAAAKTTTAAGASSSATAAKAPEASAAVKQQPPENSAAAPDTKDTSQRQAGSNGASTANGAAQGSAGEAAAASPTPGRTSA